MCVCVCACVCVCVCVCVRVCVCERERACEQGSVRGVQHTEYFRDQPMRGQSLTPPDVLQVCAWA
mgnify:CR=1 FL=1